MVAPQASRAGLFCFHGHANQKYLVRERPGSGRKVTQEVTSALNLESTIASGYLKYGW